MQADNISVRYLKRWRAWGRAATGCRPDAVDAKHDQLVSARSLV